MPQPKLPRINCWTISAQLINSIIPHKTSALSPGMQTSLTRWLWPNKANKDVKQTREAQATMCPSLSSNSSQRSFWKQQQYQVIISSQGGSNKMQPCRKWYRVSKWFLTPQVARHLTVSWIVTTMKTAQATSALTNSSTLTKLVMQTIITYRWMSELI